jgi:hypothetical protein
VVIEEAKVVERRKERRAMRLVEGWPTKGWEGTNTFMPIHHVAVASRTRMVGSAIPISRLGASFKTAALPSAAHVPFTPSVQLGT